MPRSGLTLRGLWWRKGLTAALLGVAVVTTTAAALGPLYARAAAESTLHDQLADAPVTDSGLHLQQNADVSDRNSVASAEGTAPRPGFTAGYSRRIVGISLPTSASSTTSVPVLSRLLSREGSCEHLIVQHGRCPQAAGEVMVSDRTTAGPYGIAIGATITVTAVSDNGVAANGQAVAAPAQLRVVGTYRPRDTKDPFWFGRNYFAAIPGHDGLDTIDVLLVAQAEFATLASPATAEIDLDYPLDPSAIHLAGVPGLRRDVAALASRSGAESGLPLTTALPAVLAQADHQRTLVRTGTELVTVQLALLAWLVLFQIVADAVEARGNEIALAKVRGRRAVATVRFGLGEPIVLLAVAIPIGLVLAELVTQVFAATVLAPHTPVLFTGAAVVAALTAFLGGCVAAAIAAYRTLTRSVLDQWRRSTKHRTASRWPLVMDAAIAVTAAVGLVVLGRHRSTAAYGSGALLAPGLLVVAVALPGVRLLPPLARWLAAATRGRRQLGLFLASRQVARRPAGLRLSALLAVALGLATFAVAGESIATTNRTARAQSELGAEQVASVQFRSDADPVSAVAQVDPQGRWAMAAATWLPDGGGSVIGTVLAVDTTRLAAVSPQVPGAPSSASLARTLATTSVPPVTITASMLQLRVTVTGLNPGLAPDVQINLRTARQPNLNAEGPALVNGTRDYLVPVPCQGGCDFRGITWDRPVLATAAQYGTTLVQSIEQGSGTSFRPTGARLDDPAAWRPAPAQGHASDSVRVGDQGLLDAFGNDSGGYGGVRYASVPEPLPVVSTPGGLASGPGAPSPPQMIDDVHSTATLSVTRTVPALPSVGANGVLVDLRFVRAELPSFDVEANWQVWLSAAAPADAVQRLQRAGLIVQDSKTVGERVTVLGRQGPALSLLLLLSVAVAGAVLAATGTALSISASSRRRSFELAALRAVGVPRAALLRAGIIENLLLLGTGLVLGMPSGLAAAYLALPSIPQFSDSTPITLSYRPPVGPLLQFGTVFVVLLAATALVAGFALIRLAVPARLREAEE